MDHKQMDYLDKLEAKSIYILREAYASFDKLCMLWSIGKDSTVLLWLARKAFFGHVPFPLVHVDTHYKIPEMIEYRDRLAKEYGLYMIYGENSEALKNKQTWPDGQRQPLGVLQKLENRSPEAHPERRVAPLPAESADRELRSRHRPHRLHWRDRGRPGR